MTRRATVHVLTLAIALSAPFSTTAATTSLPLPDTMAAVGDSITQAASTDGSLGADAPHNSWSTGWSTSVNSHYLRLLAAGAPIGGRNFNHSVSGAKMIHLADQMATLQSVQPDYLTVLIGGNDLCTPTFEGMTSVPAFRAQFEAAMAMLVAVSPNTKVYVVSIPDVYQLWNLFKGNWWARFIWSIGNVCQSLLANPTSTQQVDVQRRAAVRQRNIDFNTQLAQVCTAHATRCHFDGNAAFNTTFTTSDVSGDYFHPSVAGQAKLALTSWNAGYAWQQPNRAPTAVIGAPTECISGAVCSGFSGAGSSDPDGDALTYTWDFGDGTASASGSAATHTYASSAGSPYTVTLTVSDGTDSDTATASVTVTAATATLHVGGLSGSPVVVNKNTWRATVTILVHDASASPISGAVVTGSWSAGSGDTCTTGAEGRCSVESDNLSRRNLSSVTFTVSEVARDGYEYDSTANTLTSIPIARP
jgi:lysophospholipase L1-like esterase